MIDWQKVFDQMEYLQRQHGATVAARLSSEKKRLTGTVFTDQQFYEIAVWHGRQIQEGADASRGDSEG